MKTLLRNAKVWQKEGKFSEAIGFDSASGKIIFTGSEYEAKNISGVFDEIIDIESRLIIPAFTDGHCHFIEGSFVNSQLNLRNAKCLKDIEDGIRDYRHKNKTSWIFGGYFTDSNFKEKINLRKEILDGICPDVPVIISRFDMHSAFANTKALEISGIFNQQSLFSSEELIKNEKGLTGELKERAMDFVLDKIPLPDINERVNISEKQMKKLHSLGIVSISDITLPEDLEVYKELIRRGKLLLNVDARLPFIEFKNADNYRKEFSTMPDRIKFNSFKAFYDGSLSSGTALMHSNYRNTAHNGIKTEFAGSGEFQKYAFEIDKAGYQMSVHAIGDKAVTELLDLNEELDKVNGKRDRRFRIEHAQHIRESDIKRFGELNVIASVQPTHLFSDASTAKELLNDFFNTHNYRKIINEGGRVCFGTDFPVVGESPFDTIYYAMTRKAIGFEEGFEVQNKFTLEECLTAYTSENAYAEFAENDRGKLETGMKADIAVLKHNLFKMKPDEIREAEVYMTYFNGMRVY